MDCSSGGISDEAYYAIRIGDNVSALQTHELTSVLEPPMSRNYSLSIAGADSLAERTIDLALVLS